MDEKKVREAIKAMENQIAIIQKIPEYLELKEKTDEQIKERQTIIKALEKQLPEKPRENGMHDGLIRKIKYYTCPTCGNCLLTEMMNERQNTSYCWDCGQKLDWSEVENGREES